MKKTEKKIYKEFALKERPPHRCIYSGGIHSTLEKVRRSHEKKQTAVLQRIYDKA